MWDGAGLRAGGSGLVLEPGGGGGRVLAGGLSDSCRRPVRSSSLRPPTFSEGGRRGITIKELAGIEGSGTGKAAAQSPEDAQDEPKGGRWARAPATRVGGK